MNQSSPVLFTEGVMKVNVKWEDVNIAIPFDLSNNHDIVLYKAFREMQGHMKKMQSEINELRDQKDSELTLQGSLKEIWENNSDDVWGDF